MHPNSKLLFTKYAREHFTTSLRVLEIGPDLLPSTYRSMVADDSIVWDSLDLHDSQYGDRLTYKAVSEYEFPVDSDAYDIVLSGQVIEHVRRIWEWMPEVARVCKPGGKVITINPVSWPYHEAPVDCWRIYPEGMKALYEASGLTVLVGRLDALESKRRSYLPGRSAMSQPWQLRVAFAVLGRFGFPVECSYDTITIGQKVEGGADRP